MLVVGRSADSIADQAGGWSLTWQGTGNTNADFPAGDSVLAGVREAVGAGNVVYSADAKGVDVTAFQAVIAVIGETPYAEGVGDIRRSSTLEHARRHPEDLAVLERVAGQGVPVVTVLLSGRPLWVNREINRSDAFVAAWLPGTEGKGIADVLFRQRRRQRHRLHGPAVVLVAEDAPARPTLNKGDAGLRPAVRLRIRPDVCGRARRHWARSTSRRSRSAAARPAAAATEDLVIFQQAERPVHKLHIGSPPNWSVPLGDDLDAVVATADGAVQGRDRAGQRAAGRAQDHVRRRRPVLGRTRRWRATTAATSARTRRWRSTSSSTRRRPGRVHVRVDCGYPVRRRAST